MRWFCVTVATLQHTAYLAGNDTSYRRVTPVSLVDPLSLSRQALVQVIPRAMLRKRKNISQCKAEAAENKERWCKPCRYKRGANQCEGPVPETTPTPTLKPQRSSTVPFPKICSGCGVICCGVPMCFDCMRKGPAISEPTAVLPTRPAPTAPVMTSSLGRSITSPVPFKFPENQVHPVRLSMHACVNACMMCSVMQFFFGLIGHVDAASRQAAF